MADPAPQPDPSPGPLRSQGLSARVALVVALLAVIVAAGMAWIAFGSSDSADATASGPRSTISADAAKLFVNSGSDPGGITVSGSGSVSAIPTKAQ